MRNELTNSLLRRKNDKIKHKLVQHRVRSREMAQKAKTDRKEIAQLRRRIDELENYMVFEECPNCSTEVGLCWNVEQDGFKAYCPFCGGRLMLCSMCDHSPCDYNYGTDSCKYNQRKEKTGSD